MRIAVAGATGRAGHHLVDVLAERGHDVVRMSRATGVDLVSGAGLAGALDGVEVVVDAATGPSPEQAAATAWFTAAARNLRERAARAGVRRIVVVSIIGIDRLTTGYTVAKLAHEDALRAGSVPVVVLRAAQFHEFVAQLVDWGRRGDVAQVPRMRSQLVAARTVAEELARLALAAEADPGRAYEVAGPRVENLAAMAALLVRHRGGGITIEEVDDPSADAAAYADGALLPGPGAVLAGPTYEEWLGSSGAR
jgi:uncharacterized protein YbjT (DUF2867 family)